MHTLATSTEDPPGPAADHVAALCVFLFAAWLIVHGFWRPELWIDEYGTSWVVSAGSWREAVARAWQVQCQSPLYYLVVRCFTEVFGSTPLALRLPSVLCGIGTVALAFPLALRIFRDRTVAVGAVATFAVNKDLLIAAQDARPYAMGIVLTVLATFWLVALLERPSLGARAAYVVCLALLVYTNYFSVLVPAGHALYLLTRWEQRQQAWSWVATYGVVAALCAPGLLHLAHIFERRAALSWIPVGDLAMFLTWTQAMLTWLFEPAILGAAAVAMFFFGGGRRAGPTDPGARPGIVLAWFLFPALVLGLSRVVLGINLMVPRYLSVAAPAAALVSAWILGLGGATGLLRFGPTLVLLGCAWMWNLGPTLATEGTFTRHLGMGWAPATRHVQGSAQQGDLVFFGTGYVESDLVSGPDPDPLRLSFVSWPVASNLLPAPRVSLVSLPWRAGVPLDHALAALDSAPSGSTSWVLGTGEGLENFLEAARRRPDIVAGAKESFGAVGVVRLDKR